MASASSSSSSATAAVSVDLSTLPLSRLLVREKRGLLAYEGPLFTSGGENISADKYEVNPLTFPEYSSLRVSPLYDPTGRMICLVPDRQNLVLLNALDGSLLLQLDNQDAQKVEFSPLGNYLITWSLPTKGTATEAPQGNLRIWSTASGELLAAYSQKSFRNDLIQFTNDERYCFRQTTNELCVYTNGQFAQSDCVERIQQKGFTQFRITPSWEPKVTIAFFNPEAGGKPARATLFSFKKALQYEVEGPLGSRTIFGASEANLLWNQQGSWLLINSQTDVDTSNASYYGATALYIMNAKGDISNKVEQTKDGPVHDVAWSPQGDKFVIAAGNMPCQTTLYNERGEPIFQFGAAHRNTISWSPHGRFVCIAGFGNLAGEMDFYDIVRLKKLGSNSSHCATTHAWSPDSRYFMTASLAPRMNVDNCMKIFKYTGVGPVLKIDYERAFDAVWRPLSADIYPNRPPSPRRGGAEGQPAVAVPKATIAAAAPYRPPGASASFVNFMRDSSSNNAPVGKVKSNPATTGAGGKFVPSVQNQRVIPGMAPPPSKAGGAKKPAADSAKGGAPNAPKAPATPAAGCGKPTASQPKLTPAPVAAVVQPPAPPAEETAESKEKRAKALNKKLKQVQELKAKAAAGQALDAEQTKKLATEADLLAELKTLA